VVALKKKIKKKPVLLLLLSLTLLLVKKITSSSHTTTHTTTKHQKLLLLLLQPLLQLQSSLKSDPCEFGKFLPRTCLTNKRVHEKHCCSGTFFHIYIHTFLHKMFEQFSLCVQSFALLLINPYLKLENCGIIYI